MSLTGCVWIVSYLLLCHLWGASSFILLFGCIGFIERGRYFESNQRGADWLVSGLADLIKRVRTLLLAQHCFVVLLAFHMWLVWRMFESRECYIGAFVIGVFFWLWHLCVWVRVCLFLVTLVCFTTAVSKGCWEIKQTEKWQHVAKKSQSCPALLSAWNRCWKS